MTNLDFRRAIHKQVVAFEVMLTKRSKSEQQKLRATLREERGVYFRKAYSVPAMFCKLPKRRKRMH